MDGEQEKYYFGKPLSDKYILRTHRIIVRKAKSNYTSNLSLWNCDLPLEKLKELFYKVLVEDKNKYFEPSYYVINWVKEKYKSHYIIIQEFRNKTLGRSISFGVDLHDFDIDEVKEVLVKVFCNRKKIDKMEDKNARREKEL